MPTCHHWVSLVAGFMVGLSMPAVAGKNQTTSAATLGLEHALESGISIEELTEEVSSLLLGRDDRVLKWSKGRERLLTIVVTGREPKGKPSERDQLAFVLQELATELSATILQATGIHWNVELLGTPPLRPYRSDVIIRVGGWSREPKFINTSHRSYCAGVSCLGTRTATAALSFKSMEDDLLDEALSQQIVVTERGKVAWAEIANGKGNQLQAIDHVDTAHIQARVYADSDRNILLARCTIVKSQIRRMLTAEFLECFLRSLGFVGSSQMYPMSVLGVRLPERSDLFLSGKGQVPAAEYAEKLPNTLHPFDLLALRVHADNRLEPGSGPEATKQVVAKVLSELRSKSQQTDEPAK